MNKTYIIILLLIIPISGFSQRELSFSSALIYAKESSPVLKKSELSLQQSYYNLKSSRLQFWSTVDLTATLPNISKDLTQVIDPTTGEVKFVEQNYVSYSTQLAINQPIIWTDGTLSLITGLNQYHQTTTGVSGNTDRENYFGNMRLRLTQPLFTYNRRSTGLERAEIQLEIAKSSYISNQQEIIYNVKQTYYQWYKTKQLLDIATEELEQIKTSYELANRKFQSGIIAEAEVLKLEVDYASSQNAVEQKKTDVKRAENQLKILIGMPLDEKITSPVNFHVSNISIPLEQVLPTALKNRPEIKNANYQLKLQEISVMETDAFREFRADVTLEFGLTQQDPKLAEIFKNPNQAQQVSVGITIPILDWGRNHAQVNSQLSALTGRKIDVLESDKLLVNEINDLIENYKQAGNRVKILEKSVALAQKSYDISYQKFSTGTLSSEELAQSQRRLTDAKINSLSALLDYNLSVAALNKACLYDWELNQPLTDTLPVFEN